MTYISMKSFQHIHVPKVKAYFFRKCVFFDNYKESSQIFAVAVVL
ncbi:hypothetical protein HMPREF0765_2687 [Sphingobacterium spiritivorum ATCC 33300]|uniref:Uncharacterized protein n=1 Tax=Sphingobacterium spiritivorum ATCC 33300 TaxID=525372 RepID=C2FZD1_SPHSI|nr:hypothetical protein HMPREF0765_2687 [Sphingobacterium spiritivorum ATCC 33300]